MQSISDPIHCPTCRALQDRADVCRRCRSDLRLLRVLADEYQDRRVRCLRALRAGRSHMALDYARDCVLLHPDSESRRLFAVCALLSGDWQTASRTGHVCLEK